MRIKMLCTVRPDIPMLATPGTILRVGEEYLATANQNGAISGICTNGETLGVKPGEFVFVTCPRWVYKKWAWFESAVESAQIEGEQE